MSMPEELSRLTAVLQSGGYTLAVRKGDETRTFTDRGVKALYTLYRHDPDFLEGAIVADKVVGKGAAALMILGGVCAMHTAVVSESALALLSSSRMKVYYDMAAPHIINRAGTGMCPLEALCADAHSAGECLPLIDHFLER